MYGAVGKGVVVGVPAVVVRGSFSLLVVTLGFHSRV